MLFVKYMTQRSYHNKGQAIIFIGGSEASRQLSVTAVCILNHLLVKVATPLTLTL